MRKKLPEFVLHRLGARAGGGADGGGVVRRENADPVALLARIAGQYRRRLILGNEVLGFAGPWLPVHGGVAFLRRQEEAGLVGEQDPHADEGGERGEDEKQRKRPAAAARARRFGLRRRRRRAAIGGARRFGFGGFGADIEPAEVAMIAGAGFARFRRHFRNRVHRRCRSRFHEQLEGAGERIGQFGLDRRNELRLDFGDLGLHHLAAVDRGFDRQVRIGLQGAVERRECLAVDGFAKRLVLGVAPVKGAPDRFLDRIQTVLPRTDHAPDDR